MSKYTILALCALVLTCSSACYHVEVVTDARHLSPSGTAYPNSETMAVHIFGIISVNNRMNLDQICPQGVGMVEAKTILQFQWFTSLPITLERMSVYCLKTT